MSALKIGVQCSDCGKRLFSWSVHDYKTCGCPNETMVDGGDEYLRCGAIKNLPTQVVHDEEVDGPCGKESKASRWPY